MKYIISLFMILVLFVSLFASAREDRSFLDAENYYKIGNYTQAMNSMKRVDQEYHNHTDYLLLLAKLQIATGDYEEALATLNDYRSEGGEGVPLTGELYATIADATDFAIQGVILDLPGRLNSIHSEYLPFVNAEGDFMVFGSDRRSPYKGENIFYSALVDGSWTEPMEIKELATDRNETAGSFDKDGNLYIAGQYGNKKKAYNNSIYIAYNLGKKFGSPQKVDALSSNFNDINPSVSSGNTMVFASTRGGDHKSYDLYVSEYSFGTWSTPVSLGSTINTSGNEITPFLAPGGHLLFFASDTHPGFGGFDLFVSKRTGASWTEWGTPINLGPIINSSNDDRGFSLAENSLTAYYSSNRFAYLNMENILGIDLEKLGYRLVHGYVHDETNERVQTTVNWSDGNHDFFTKTDENGEFRFLLSPTKKVTYYIDDERYFFVEGEEDIVQRDTEIIIPVHRKNVLRLAGRVYDQYDDPVHTTINWTYVNEGETVKRGSKTNDDGHYIMEVPNIRYIDFDIQEQGYVALKGRWNLIEGESYQTRDFVLTVYAKGQAYAFVVEFDYDKSDIRTDTMPEVVKMYNMLNENPTMKVEIAGHTDIRGSEAYNMGLSQRRADSVRNELVRRGINRNRMQTGAYGFSRPLADNDTEEGMQRNRRVEMIVLSIDQ
ncbi:MAG: OmpA family protein [Candidatus Cloacimonetes bacterium]|nr:OmpA family protein [Candidatus Cloacimonadota bacterium]